MYQFSTQPKNTEIYKKQCYFCIDIFPKNEIEGIKEFYVYHNDVSDIYNDIIHYFINTIHCNSITLDNQIQENDIDDIQRGFAILNAKSVHSDQVKQQKHQTTICNGVTFTIGDDDEINIKIFKSGQYTHTHSEDHNNVYLIRMSRISGDYIKFLRIKQKIVDNILCFYPGLPVELEMESLDNNHRLCPSPLSLSDTVTKNDPDAFVFDYSVYNDCQKMMDEEDDDNMVWIEY